MPTPRRAAFIITNIAFKPLFGSPTIQPFAPSRFITHVELPWMPILCSIEPHLIPLRSPGSPDASGMNFGTMNSEIPFVPCGASGRRASTRWMMFFDMSCSPLEMKIFVPLIEYEPSPLGSALVRRMPRSVPQCGSVRHIVPVHSPDTSFGRYCFCSSGAPCACRHS